MLAATLVVLGGVVQNSYSGLITDYYLRRHEARTANAVPLVVSCDRSGRLSTQTLTPWPTYSALWESWTTGFLASRDDDSRETTARILSNDGKLDWSVTHGSVDFGARSLSVKKNISSDTCAVEMPFSSNSDWSGDWNTTDIMLTTDGKNITVADTSYEPLPTPDVMITPDPLPTANITLTPDIEKAIVAGTLFEPLPTPTIMITTVSLPAANITSPPDSNKITVAATSYEPLSAAINSWYSNTFEFLELEVVPMPNSTDCVKLGGTRSLQRRGT
ncbi:hypothetical protein F5B18DRAFT_632016 [Nemania serpens]|nr:hypothetical protein F5B18DRAFT_632016 [Nemania serpens]